MEETEKKKKKLARYCPFCHNRIAQKAKKCRHCGFFIKREQEDIDDDKKITETKIGPEMATKGVALDVLGGEIDDDTRKKIFVDFRERYEKPEEKESEDIAAYPQIPREEARLERCEEALEENPRDPVAWFAKGIVLVDMKLYEKALECFDRVSKLDKFNKEVWNAKAEALSKLGRHDDAAGCYKKALELAITEAARRPDGMLEAQRAIDDLLQELEEDDSPEVTYSRDLKIYERRVKKNPKNVDAWYSKALILDKLGRHQEALNCLNEVTKLDLTYKNVWKTKGDLFIKIGDEKKAGICYKRAQEFIPERTICSLCGNSIFADATMCPKCGAEFEPDHVEVTVLEGAEIERKEGIDEYESVRIDSEQKVLGPSPPSRPMPEPAHPYRPPWSKGDEMLTASFVSDESIVKREGRINGLINGLRTGRTNGFVNGFNLVREGLTNGLTNGMGHTNGLGSPRMRKDMVMNRWKMYIIPLVAVMLVFTPFITPSQHAPYYNINIDGDFSDWDGLTTSLGQDTQLDPNIDIVNVGIENNKNYLSFYIETRETILQGGDGRVDTFHVFLDSDLDYGTGYKIKNLGADHMLSIYGKDGNPISSILKTFDNARDHNDWNGWTSAGSSSVAANGNSLETQIDWEYLGGEEKQVDALFYSQSHAKEEDFSEFVLSNVKGILKVDQKSVASEIISTDSDGILQVTLMAVGSDISITNLDLRLLGTASSADIGMIRLTEDGIPIDEKLVVDDNIRFSFSPPIELKEDESKVWLVSVDVKTVSGRTVGATIQSMRDIKVESGSVSLNRQPSDYDLGYIGMVPSGTVIDGGYSDWKYSKDDFDQGSIMNPDINIQKYNTTTDGDNIYFYMSVEGALMNGTSVPHWNNITGEVLPSGPYDSDRDRIPDSIDPYPYDFDNDGVPDVDTDNDVDGDGNKDYPHGQDHWLNTTIPNTTAFSEAEEWKGKPVNIYIGPVEKPPTTGEDYARIYLDTDGTSGFGYFVGDIWADYMIEIEGKNGEILLKRFSEFSGSFSRDWSWTFVKEVDDLELGRSQMEGSVDVSALGLVQPISAFIETSDWEMDTDMMPSSEEVKSIVYNEEGTKTTEMNVLTTGISSSGNDGFGWNVSYAGDVNNDGYSDIIVGAPYNDSADGSKADAGAAYIFFGYPGIGSNNINPASANVSIYGENAGDLFGWSVSDLGNVNSDTKDDVIIGAPGYDVSDTFAWGSTDKVVNQNIGAGFRDGTAIAVDQYGNTIVVWQFLNGSGDWNIMAQKINCTGDAQWGASDVQVNQYTDSNDRQNPDVAVDPDGNAIVVWQDERNDGVNADIYAQKLDPDGNALWGSSDVQVNQYESSYRWYPTVAVDRDGDAIVAWHDARPSSQYDIYAQKISSFNGSYQWGSSDVKVNQNSDTTNQEYPSIAIDSSGNAIIAWQDKRHGSTNISIYAQKLDSDGNVLWSSSDVRVNQNSDSANRMETDVAVDTSGNAIIVWQDERNGTSNDDIYAQKLNPFGGPQWGFSDKKVNQNSDSTVQEKPVVAVDSYGNATVVWQDNRIAGDNDDIYAQKLVSFDGAYQWGSSDKKINQNTAESTWQLSPDVAVHSNWNVIVAWRDEYNGHNIRAQKFIAGGQDRGRAYVFFGRASWSSSYDASLADLNISGESDGDRFGSSVSGAGDVDNSDYRDVVVGAPYYDGHDWWNDNWSYRRKLTFNNSGQDEDLVNSPVLVNLSSSNFDYFKAKSNGTDLRFVDADGSTELKYHIEDWQTSRYSYVWVNVTEISANSSTDYIWMYYGNSEALDGQDTSGTYDNNYVGVWHLSENATGTRYDSTSNDNDGDPQNYDGDETTTGKIDGADDIDGDDDYIDCGNNASLNIGTAEGFSLIAWIYPEELDDSQWWDNVLFSKLQDDNNRFYFRLRKEGVAQFYSVIGGTIYNAEGDLDDGYNFTKGSWYMISWVIDRTEGSNGVLKVYHNEDLAATFPFNENISGVDFSNTGDGWIGAYSDFGTPNWLFNGIIDEVRISNTARSAEWIKAQYLSMNYSFVTYGNEESKDRGRAYIFHGDGSIPPQACCADATLTGEAGNDLFGFSVSNAGDIDNDGKDNVIIGAPFNNGGGRDAGRAYILVDNQYTYVNSNTVAYGWITDFANAQNASDSGAYATLKEQQVGSGDGEETLRPDAAGAKNGWDTGDHNSAKDQNDATYLEADNATWAEALFSTDDHSTGAGTVNWIRVYLRFKRGGGQPGTAEVRTRIKSDSTETTGNTWTCTDDWQNSYMQYNTNPADSQVWEWSDIDNLQIGADGRLTAGAREPQVAEVWIVVNYTNFSYEMDIQFNTTGVHTALNYNLQLNYSVDGTETDVGVLVYNTDSEDWDDLSWQGDLKTTSFYMKEYLLNSSHRTSSGDVRVRFIGRNESSDIVNSTLNIEYHRVESADTVVMLTGETARDYFGWSVANASDINQDGTFDDVIVGAPKWHNTSGDYKVVWDSSDVRVHQYGSSMNQVSSHLAAYPDGTVIFVWEDYRLGTAYPDIWAQRYDSDGNPLWNSTTDVKVNQHDDNLNPPSSRRQLDPRVALDSDGNAIIVWDDYRNGDTNREVYAQKLDLNGNPLWDSDDIMVNQYTTASMQTIPDIGVDSDGNAIVVWHDDRNGDWDIYAQKIDSNGVAQWSISDVKVNQHDDTQNQYNAFVTIDSNGDAIVVWRDYRNNPHHDVFAQKLASADGDALWDDTNDVKVNQNSDTAHQQVPAIDIDSDDNVIIVWFDERHGSDNESIYAQKFDSDANPLWGSSDKRVNQNVGTFERKNPDVAVDIDDNAIVVWDDERHGATNETIYAQKLDSDGNALWNSNDVRVNQYNDDYEQSQPEMTVNLYKDAFVLWRDYRNNIDYDIYAQKLEPLSPGRAYIFHGASSMDAISDLNLTGENDADKFGFSVHGVADIDGDGLPDVAIGAPYYDNGASTDAGIVYVFEGGSSMDSSADWYYKGSQANEHFGWSVSFAISMDGGVYNNVVVGAPHYDDGANTDSGEGKVLYTIPEYSTVLVPMALVIVLYAWTRKERRKRGKR